ncbi:Dynamin-associated protein, partial [Operophtera brumata]
SQLPPPVLGQIWSLADTNADGKLDLKEFSIACKPPIPPMPTVPPLPVLPPQPLMSGMPAQSMSSNSLLGDFNNSPLINTTPAQNMMPNQPVMGTTQLIMSTTQPIMGNTQPIMGNTQPIMGTQPMMPPVIPPMKPSVPDLISGPIMSTNQSIMGTSQPIMGTSQPIMGTSQPIMPSSQVGSLIPQSPPHVPTGTPVASLISSPPKAMAMAGSTPQPVTVAGGVCGDEPHGAAHGRHEPAACRVGHTAATETQVTISPTLPCLVVVYTQLFNATDRLKAGAVSGAQARAIMLQSRLPQQTLAQIWALADLDSDGKLAVQRDGPAEGGRRVGRAGPRHHAAVAAAAADPRADLGVYAKLFNATVRVKAGAVSGAQARAIMLQSRLPQQTLAQIWALADLGSDGKLVYNSQNQLVSPPKLSKIELDAKAKATDGASEDGKLNMMEVTLKQLRDKVDAARAIVDHKKRDLSASDTQLSDLTAQVSQLKDKCETVWQLYQQRSAASAPVWRCIYPFSARSADELALQPGDLYFLLMSHLENRRSKL